VIPTGPGIIEATKSTQNCRILNFNTDKEEHFMALKRIKTSREKMSAMLRFSLSQGRSFNGLPAKHPS
jgi:hypothetical protein